MSIQAHEKCLTDFLVSNNYCSYPLPDSCFDSDKIYCNEHAVGSMLLKQTWMLTPSAWQATKVIIDRNKEMQVTLMISECASDCAELLVDAPIEQKYVTLLSQYFERELLAAGISVIHAQITDDQWGAFKGAGFTLDNQHNALPLCKKIKKVLQAHPKTSTQATLKYQESNLKNVLAGLYNYPHTQS
jgi:hypothetical protein